MEACRCIRELGVLFFHHEVVKRSLILAMDIQTSEPRILKLLKEASEAFLISYSQMTKGFSRLAESLDDLSLDIPSAKSLFESLVSKAVSEGWLDSSFLKCSVENGVDIDNEEYEKVKRYKEETVTIIHEYFLSDDIPALIRNLRDLSAPVYNPLFPEKASHPSHGPEEQRVGDGILSAICIPACLLLLLPQLLSTCSLRMKINNGRKGFTQDHRARERAFAYLLNRALLSYLYPLSFSYIQSQFCFQLPMGEGLDV